MTERDLLAILCHFITTKEFVQGDKESILDMVARYKSPPFTMAYPCYIRLSMKDTNELNEIIKQAHEYLSSTADTPLATPIVIPDEADEK